MERFAQLDDLTKYEEEAANTRAFTGQGTPFLEVPGLIKVTGVRVASHQMPLTETREYPIDQTLTRLNKVEEPMVDLQVRSDGTAVLIRSNLSNNGKWAKDVPVYVSGEWEAEEPKAVKKAA